MRLYLAVVDCGIAIKACKDYLIENQMTSGSINSTHIYSGMFMQMGINRNATATESAYNKLL